MTTIPNKTVTAILPNYNYARYIATRVQEILNQTYPVAEIIFLDDCSTDGSQKVITELVRSIKKQHPSIKLVTNFNRKNSKNVFSQWQKGISLASSEYIWICELDDSSSPTFLDTAMQGLKQPDVILSYTNSKITNVYNHLILKDSIRQVKDFFRRSHAFGSYISNGEDELNNNLAIFNPIPNVSAAVFKNIPELHSILNESKKYHLSGDWFFYIELARRGKIAYSNKRLNIHRLHPESVTGQTSFKQRFFEMHAIHEYVQRAVKLRPQTIQRIDALEQRLKKRWKI